MKFIINIWFVFVLATTVSPAQSLEDYFRMAAESNPELQAKYKEYEAALQKIPQVSSMTDPVFSFGYFLSPVETRVGPQRAKFSLVQMFPWFGTLRAQGDAAALLAESRFQEFLDARNRLWYRVASAYYPLYELHTETRIEEENIAILESFKTIANAKFRNEKSPMVDVLRVEIMMDDALTNLEILQQKEKPLLAAFNSLLNRDAQAPVEVIDSVIISPVPEDFRRDSLLNGNPALHALELKIRAGEAAEEAAVRQGLPKLGAGLDYVIVGEGPLAAADNGKDVLMPMVSLSIPLFRKKVDAAVKEARLKQEQYALEKNAAENNLTAGYEMAWFEISHQQQLIALYRKQARTSRQSLNLLLGAYENSGNAFEEVLRMQQQLLKYEKLTASSETAYLVALAKLNYLTAKTYQDETNK